MNDEIKYSKHEEEYQFPTDGDCIDDDLSEEPSEHEEEPTVADDTGSTFDANSFQLKMKEIATEAAERFPIVKNKKVLAVLGFVLVVMIVLHFSHPAGKNDSVNTDAMGANQTSVSSPVPDQVKNSMNTLTSQEAATSNTVNSLKGQVNQVNSSIGSLQQDQHVTNVSVRQLSEQLKAVNVQLAEIAKIQQNLVHPKSEEAVKKAQPVIFHLKAVSSGRAWIVDNNGVSETVIVGSTVNKNYGTVVGIDSDQGMVYTSSKKVISFGASDH
jgi:hypothetical protein